VLKYHGHEPHLVQLVSVLLLIRSKEDHCGLIAEIATGEGKSLIIAMTTIIKALAGLKVDIITSSSLLAERDQEIFSGLYLLFCLHSATNISSEYTKGLKPCYDVNINIIIGDMNSFLYDLLREIYSRLGTRGGRPFGFLVVDEVDNLFIDEG